uniref:Uncharacterized protein n=1 Tax=Fundidesulfovibrio putealis TaxID=270496 RepID=A0A7C4AFX3_9BACT
MKKALVVIALLLAAQAALLGFAPAQSPAPLDPQEKRKLDTFFSNFAETMMPSFPAAGPSDKQMLEFATTHLAINAENSLKKSPDAMTLFIPTDRVDAVTEKYLGRKLSHHSGNRYAVPAASGEIYVFAQVDKLSPLGPDTFVAEGTVYYASSGETLDPHASPSAWKKARKTVQPSGFFKGVVRKVQEPGPRFVLVQYDMVRTDM